MINKNIAKLLSFRYTILAAILILLAAGLVFLPKYQMHDNKVAADNLLEMATNPERYISTDELADILINKVPTYLLIDVRDSASFQHYSIPGSVNVPLENLLDDDNKPYLAQEQYDIVFISNDDFNADQAWIISRRMGYDHLKVLKGGINQWFNTIINPPKPAETMPEVDQELYATRKAASTYFGVRYPDQIAAPQPVKTSSPTPKKVIPVAKKKAKVEGGC